jgi:RecB family exonuclease
VTPALEDALRRRDVHRPKPASELVELVATHARRTVLCYRVADDDGAALAPSPLVAWLERGGIPATTMHATPLIGAPTTPHERALVLVALAPDRALRLAPYAARVAAREAEREAFHASQGSSLTIRGAPELRSLLEIETGGGARALSVTAVERMARCAFQGFAAQVLGALDDDPRADDVPDRREEGILTHEALAAAFTAAAPLFRVRPRDHGAIERAASRAADGVLARSGGAVVLAAFDRIRLEVAKVVALAAADEAWDFARAEQSFGDPRASVAVAAGEGGWPAFVVADGRTRVALRGRIDRVDEARGGSAVRAIDYKRRVSLPPITDLGGAAIQVPLYALVAQRAFGASSAQGRYLSTVSPAAASTAAFDERFAELVKPDESGSTEVSRVVLELLRSLRAGEIAPRPSAPKWCAQCGLDGACRRPRFAVTLAREAEAGPLSRATTEDE